MIKLLVKILPLVFVFSAWSSAYAAVIGSVADSRFGSTWTLDGTEQANARAKILNSANFGPAGTVTEAMTIVDTAAPITTDLLSGFDIFYIGYLSNSSPNAFTGAELTAMTSYVTGGGVMVVTCDDSGHDAVCSNFGFPTTTPASNPMTPTAYGPKSSEHNVSKLQKRYLVKAHHRVGFF